MNDSRFSLALALTVCVLLVAPVFAADAEKPASATGITRQLEEFGPLDKPQQAQETYEKALQSLRASGGVLVAPASVWKQLKQLPLQGLVRTPQPPGETKRWQDGAGVTVISADQKQVIVQVPPLSGLRIERTVRLGEGDSLPHWGTHPAITLDSKLVYGSNSYLDWLQEPVEKGDDRRFYLATVRGIHPGQFLNIHGGPGYGGGVTRACVKSLGYDMVKAMHYLVADTALDHKAGAILHNKNNTGLIHMLQTSNNDNQTYDVKIIRNQYAHGDTYMYYCDFNYMSNVHSAAGDENGNCYAAFIRTLDNNFQSTVESVDWNESRLRFSTAARNVETLGDSRPLINRNPQKAITDGKVLIVPPACFYEPTDEGGCRFQGKSYPSELITNARTGSKELKMGGLIRGDKNCPWTQDVVGRYFAIANPEEKTPKGSFRWYLITALRQNDDGTKDIEIRRYWWGAKSVGSPLLYRRDSYTWDEHFRPLDYVIAPGTYVNDVSRALAGGDRGGERLLGVAPYRDQASSFDFEAGDQIEQAIGPDPFKPQVFRAWMWEDVPGSFPSAVFDIRNNGAASRHSVLTVDGGGATLEAAGARQEQKPAWDNLLVFNAAAGVGLNYKADFANAAILFQQPNHEQPIKWHYAHQEGKSPQEAKLTVSKESGEFQFEGGGLRAGGSISGVRGLSGDATPAKNLRGKNVKVEEKAKALRVSFPRAEADGDYAVFIEQSWLTPRAISEKGPDGFTVSFSEPAPDKATLDWMIVR